MFKLPSKEEINRVTKSGSVVLIPKGKDNSSDKNIFNEPMAEMLFRTFEVMYQLNSNAKDLDKFAECDVSLNHWMTGVPMYGFSGPILKTEVDNFKFTKYEDAGKRFVLIGLFIKKMMNYAKINRSKLVQFNVKDRLFVDVAIEHGLKVFSYGMVSGVNGETTSPIVWEVSWKNPDEDNKIQAIGAP
jgi:hypothetical protein